MGHDFGWTDFNVDATTGELLVTTYGVPGYTDADLTSNPAAVIALNPTIVSQFEVTPTSDAIIGTARNDDLRGTNNADVIVGAAGNDDLQGRGGDDYLDGGKGNDVVRGGAGEDRIFGRDGNDRLEGQDGDDLIDGGLGNDKLNGGAGADSFLFATPLDATTNLDMITDYAVSDDTIWLDNAVFTALTSTGTLAVGNFTVGPAAADADDFIIYNQATGTLYYDADGSGAGAQVRFVALGAGLAMTHSDFFVV